VLRLIRPGSGIHDAAGNALENDPSDAWTFQGVGAPPSNRQTILGTIGNDVILITGSGASFAVTVNGVAQTIDATKDELLIDALAGDDQIIADASVTRSLLVTGSGGNDTIAGGSGDDELSGANGKDRILGGDGADFLLGGAFNDYVNGEAGDDLVLGAGGFDKVHGGTGNNWLIGGAGNDVLFSNPGTADTISGNTGTDVGVNLDDGNDGTAPLDTIAGIETRVRT
jgi:Ca2+-binding RTX toxin-like protein